MRTKELEAALAYQANNYTPEQFIMLDNMQRGDVTATALRILAAEVRRLESENAELSSQNDTMIDMASACRAAAGFGTDKDPMEQEGWDAFGDPSCVPDFIKAQFDAAHARIAELEAELKKWAPPKCFGKEEVTWADNLPCDNCQFSNECLEAGQNNRKRRIAMEENQ